MNKASARVNAVGSVLLALALLGGCSKDKTFYAAVLGQFKDGGCKVDAFAKTESAPYAAAECARGKVDQLDVLICRFAEKGHAQAQQARVAPFFKGALSGAMRVRETLLVAVADRDKQDPAGKKINRLLKIFVGGGKS